MMLTCRTVNLCLLHTQWLQLCSEVALGHEDGLVAAGQNIYAIPHCLCVTFVVSFLTLLYCDSPKLRIISCTLVTDGVDLVVSCKVIIFFHLLAVQLTNVIVPFILYLPLLHFIIFKPFLQYSR